MRKFVVSKGSVPRIKTHKIVKDATWVVHTDEQRDALWAMPGFECEDILVHGLPDGMLVDVRDWIERELVRDTSWYCSMDDNIERIEMVIPEIYHGGDDHCYKGADEVDRDEFRHQVTTSKELDELLLELVEQSALLRTNYAGFGWLENPFFRKRKWQNQGYVKGKLFVKRPDTQPWRWRPEIVLMNDHAKTFDTIARYGAAVVNHWVYVHHTRFEPGGLGSYEERLPRRLVTCAALYETFAGMITAGKTYDDPRMTLRSERTLTEWRKKHGYLPETAN